MAELKKSDIDLQESEMGIVDFINEELPHCDRVPQTERILQKNQSDWLKTSKALLQRQQLEPRVVKAVSHTIHLIHSAVAAFISVNSFKFDSSLAN